MSGLSGRALIATAALLVFAAIGAGLAIVGPPGAAREVQGDRTRLEHLRQISRAADLHWTRRREIAASLDELAAGGQDAVPRQDPSGQPYEYRAVDDETYEVCARFERPSSPPATGDFWQHQDGRQCFRVRAREVRP
jgi:hypothetical protein